MSKYKMEDINIGDGVFFKMPHVDNYDLFWTVEEKGDNWVRLRINEMGRDDMRFVGIEHIEYIEKRK